MTVDPPAGYLPPPAPQGGVVRPGTVTIASLLLYLLGLLLLIMTVVSIISVSSISTDVFADIYADQGMDREDAQTAANAVKAVSYGTAVIYVLIAVVLVICGVFVAKGKQWARVTSWVFAGLVLCCGLGNVISASIGSAFSGQGNQAEIQRRLLDEMPGWVQPVNLVITIAWLLSAIAVIILLAMPPSHPYFRKPEAAWTPPAYPAA